MIPESVTECDGCKTRHLRSVYHVAWWNGIAHISRWFCPRCVRAGVSPPLKQIRAHGGTVRKYKQETDQCT